MSSGSELLMPVGGKGFDSTESIGDDEDLSQQIPELDTQEEDGHNVIGHALLNGDKIMARPPGHSGLLYATFNNLKCFLGVGILSLPYAFGQAGSLAGLIGIFMIAWANWYCTQLLLKCQEKVIEARPNSHISFSTLGYIVAGPAGRYTVNLGIIVLQFGTCVAYLIFISGQISAVIGIKFWIVALMVYPFAFFLTCVRDMKYLAKSSLFALSVLILAVGTVIGYGVHVNSEAGAGLYWSNGIAWSTVPKYFGTAAFAFEGIAMALPIKNSMINPERYAGFVMNTTYAITAFLYALVGSLGLALYGAGVGGGKDLIQNIPNPLGDVVRVAYSVVLLLSFPIQLFVLVQVVEKKFRHSALRPSESRTDFIGQAFVYEPNRILFRFLLCWLMLSLAIMFQNSFNNFLDLVGALAGAILIFIAPITFYLKAHELRLYSVILHLLLLASGLTICSIAVYLAIQEIFF
eukprot:gnl/Hemi2/693_TR251_c0_g1_i1.p1 gnl/Hemi2/693_TR251_c0_g1~~gnl/Hemi2/693_TR251_c0_g1_i1.p1  ORF type:complete len:463 (+),score=164.35 gnl/Hemi2/693_TR251_c0_g1_i1:150-1538(+)